MKTKQLNGFEYFLLTFKKYAVFKGRSTRSEFWYFVLGNALIMTFFWLIFGELVIVYLLIIVVPSFAIGVRRLHDIGKSGKRLFYVAIPAFISLLILVNSIYDISKLPDDAGMGALPVLAVYFVINAVSLGFTGIIFLIFSIIYFAKKTQLGINEYGPNPFDFAEGKPFAKSENMAPTPSVSQVQPSSPEIPTNPQ